MAVLLCLRAFLPVRDFTCNMGLAVDLSSKARIGTMQCAVLFAEFDLSFHFSCLTNFGFKRIEFVFPVDGSQFCIATI